MTNRDSATKDEHRPWQGDDAPEECMVCDQAWPCPPALKGWVMTVLRGPTGHVDPEEFAGATAALLAWDPGFEHIERLLDGGVTWQHIEQLLGDRECSVYLAPAWPRRLDAWRCVAWGSYAEEDDDPLYEGDGHTPGAAVAAIGARIDRGDA